MVEDYLPFPEDFERGLAVVAHPDDLEYGGAAAARLPGARLATAFEVIAT